MPYLTRNVLNWPLCHYYLHTFVLSYSPTSIVSRRRRHRRPLLFFCVWWGSIGWSQLNWWQDSTLPDLG